jgi:uncharacterized protein with FMN-binding domain
MRRAVFAILSTIAGLVGLLSFKTHSASVATPPAAVSNTGSGTTSGGGAGNAAGSSASSGSSSHSSGASSSSKSKTKSTASSSSATKTVTGDAVDTQYGPVQVRITVSNGKLTSATAIVYPTQDPRDAQINAYAIPVLEKESVGATSANLDMVSGATYTSEGYLQSLQSALNRAGL